MLRFTSLALIAACASSAAPPPPSPITNQVAITRFQLQPTHVRGMEGRHSAQHSSSELAGSLQLAGAQARLVLDITTRTSYIGCPDGWDRSHRQACVDSVPPGAEQPQTSTLDLVGTATWRGAALHIEVSREVQPNRARPPFTIRIALACSEDATELACSVEDTERLFGFARELRFSRAKYPVPARAPAHDGPRAPQLGYR